MSGFCPTRNFGHFWGRLLKDVLPADNKVRVFWCLGGSGGCCVSLCFGVCGVFWGVWGVQVHMSKISGGVKPDVFERAARKWPKMNDKIGHL